MDFGFRRKSTAEAKPAAPVTGGGAAADIIKDTTTAGFIKDVIEASKQVLVLVDFWAPWCGPCKQLTPILEKVVRAAGGKVRLVKMNIDEHPTIPGQMGVQSIPAVFAFKAGRPVDGFMGALGETQIKQFIDRLLGPGGGVDAPAADIAEAVKAGEAALQAGQLQEAAEIFAAVLGEDKLNVDAIAGLARCHLNAGDHGRVEETLALAPPDKAGAAAIASVRAALDLARKAPKPGELARLQALVVANPADHTARFDLALALAAQGERQQAAEQLLELMRRDRKWNEEAARKQLVQLFEVWGPTDPLTIESRRRLSSILFS